MKQFALVLGLGLSLAGSVAHAADDETMTMTTTRPAKGAAATSRPSAGPALGNGPGAQMLRTLRDNADRLKLSEDQRVRLQEIANDTREKARQILEDAGGDREKVREKLTGVTRDAFEKVRAVLSTEQRQQLRDLLAERGRMGAGEAERPEKKVEKEHTASPAIATGEAVDYHTLELRRPNGANPLKLSALTGRPTVIVFGSYSCPTFRERVKELDALATRFGPRVNFIWVYTREAHPKGGWEVERNKDAEIAIEPHKDIEQRERQALSAKAKLGVVGMQLAVDSMDDRAVRAFGPELFPNGAVILDRDGNNVAQERWADARQIRSILEQLSSAKPTSRALSAG